MDNSSAVVTQLCNGVENETLFDHELLKQLDWSKSKHLFNPEISPMEPGKHLIMRPLRITDYDKGFPAILSQLTELGEVSREKFVETFQKLKSHKDSYYITVIEDTTIQQIIGSATLFIEQKFIHSCALRGRIEDVLVSDTHRGKQLGKLIVETLKQLAKHIGCYKLSLDCRDQMAKFYTQLGFNREEGNSNFMTVRFHH